MSTTTESASASEIETNEEGTQIKGKDFIFLNAPAIDFPENAPLDTDKRELYSILNELFSGDEGGGDVFLVSGSEGGITVTMVKNRGGAQELITENFTFKTKTYKTVTTVKSGKTSIQKTWSKVVVTEVQNGGAVVWKFTLNTMGAVTAILDSVGNDVLNGKTSADGNSIITPTPEGVALGWALAYNNEQSSAMQKAIDAYQDGVEDCDEINKSEGVGGGGGDGDGTGDGTGGDGTGDGDGTGGNGTGGLPKKEFGKIELPDGNGAASQSMHYSSNGELTSYSISSANQIIVTKFSNGTYQAEYKGNVILTTYTKTIYGTWRESTVRHDNFTFSGFDIDNYEFYGDVIFE